MGNQLLPHWVTFEMERDYLTSEVQVSNASSFLVPWTLHDFSHFACLRAWCEGLSPSPF